jgi:hypothetical protein
LLLAALAGPTTGCYRYAPVSPGATAPGMQLALDLNDDGRVALRDSIGPSATRVDGEVRARTDSGYVLSVAGVHYMSGARNRWSGEPLTVRANFVQRATERRFSRTRTLLVAGGAVALLVAFGISQDLLGGGNDNGPGDDGGEVPNTRRVILR